MPRYVALENGYLGKEGYKKAGDEFEYAGKPGRWMKPLTDAAPPPPAKPLTKAEKQAAAIAAAKAEKEARRLLATGGAGALKAGDAPNPATGAHPAGDSNKGTGSRDVL